MVSVEEREVTGLIDRTVAAVVVVGKESGKLVAGASRGLAGTEAGADGWKPMFPAAVAEPEESEESLVEEVAAAMVPVGGREVRVRDEVEVTEAAVLATLCPTK